MGESKVDISYIDSGYIWSRNFMESFLKFLSSIKKEIEGVSEKAFIDMEIEIINAYREQKVTITLILEVCSVALLQVKLLIQ